jgi:hypothetical protein
VIFLIFDTFHQHVNRILEIAKKLVVRKNQKYARKITYIAKIKKIAKVHVSEMELFFKVLITSNLRIIPT